MKKLKLLLAFCALLLGWSNASAQSWTGNAPAESTTFYLYNVGQQKFLTSGNWWGTHAALDTDGMPVTLTLSDGAYKIYDTAVSFGTSKGLGGNEYVDNDSPVAWTFTQIGSTGKYTLKNGSNYFVSNGNGVPVNTTTEPTTDDGYWQLVTKDQLIANLNNATPENPIDASFYMTNPRVRRNWPKSISGTGLSDNGSFNASAEGLYAGGCTSYGQYHKTFDNYQALTGVKNGKYKVTVKGFNRLDGGDNNSAAYLYANSQKITLKTKGDIGGDDKENATKALVDDTYLSDPVTVTVTDGNLRVGVKSDANCGWTTFAQFTLMFVDPYISDVATSFTSGNTMEAGQWYKYTIPTDGDYSFSAIDGIVYSTTDALASDTHSNVSSTTALPAGTVYIKSNTSQTLTVNFVEPVVANGDYYLYDETNKVFLSRGNHYGTQASIDPYGIPFTYNNYEKSLRFKDWTNAGLFYDGSEYFTDGGTPGKFIFETTEGGFYFKDQNNSKYLKNAAGSETRFGNNSLVQATSTSDATVWTLKTKAEHDAIVATYSTDNKTSVIASAGISTTAEDFESYLATNLAAKDKTTSVGTYNFDGNAAGDWTWTQVESRSGGAINYADKVAEAYLNTGFWTQTVEGLQPGIYKVGVNAFERETSYATCNTLGAEGYEIVTAYFEANGEKVQLKSWYSDKTGTNNPDSRAQSYTAFFNDKYKNEVYTYVADGGTGTGTLTLKVAKPAYADRSWVLFNNITLTYYDANVSDDDATAILDEANTTMDSPMKHSLYDALSTAKETFDGARTVPNYNALRAAIDNTATSIASYANMNTNYLSPLATYFETTNFVDQTSDAYTTYLGYKNSYDNYKTTGADVENATANALNWKSGDRYVTPINGIMMVSWKIGDTDALTNNSGFYMNTWSTESAGEGDAKDFANPFFEYWVGSGSLAANTLTGTLTGLKANQAYDITAIVRVQGDSKVTGSITMEVVGGVPVDVTAGDKIGTTSRYIKSYTATGVTDADGNLELKFNVAANSNVSWLSFRDVNYAESEVTISNDFTEINTAISDAEAHTLGFEAGEYAPYTNIAGLNAIATAKDFDKSRYYIPAVINNAASALSSVSWTVNAEEKNAVYNGDFSLSTNNGAPAGWILTNATNTTMGGDYRPRAFVLTSGDGNYAKLASFGQGDGTRSAFYFRFDDRTAQDAVYTYGSTDGYTMPLKENTVYKLTAQIGGWGQTNNIKMAVVNSSDEDVVAQTNTLENVDASGSVTDYEMYFVVPASGNYKLRLTNATSGQNNAAVISNIVLKSADALEFSEDADAPAYAPGTYPSVTLTRTIKADTWNTFVVPFAINNTDLKAAFGNDVAIAEYSETADGDNSEVTFAIMATPEVAANTPVLLKTSAAGTSYEFTNRTVAAAGEAKVEGTNYDFVGSYKSSITLEDGDYFISSNNLYKNEGATVTLKGTRAYIKVKGTPNNVKILNFIIGDGTATGVEAPEVAEAEEEEILYNTAGIRVGKDYKGIVINQKGEKRLQK